MNLRIHPLLRYFCIFLFFLLACPCTSLLAQRAKPQLEEEVRVFTFNEWRDGTVVAKGKKGAFIVSYEFVGKEREGSFDRRDIRKLCEVEALDFARTWRSTDGKFQIVAALKDVIKKEDVILIREDLKVITLKKSKLGKTDVAYVDKMVANFEKSQAKKEKTAQRTKLEVDEEVLTYFFGSWRESTVKDLTEDGFIIVDLDFWGEKRMNRGAIRKKCEVNAIDYVRTWKSANDSFSVDAALRTVEDENVVLIREDLKRLTVPLEKLDPQQANYANKVVKKHAAAVATGETPALTPELPELKEFSTDSATSLAWLPEEPDMSAGIGKAPSFLREFSVAGQGFDLIRKSQKATAVIPIGGPDQIVALTADESKFEEFPFQSQLYWISMAKQKLLGSVAITAGHKILDYDPQRKLLLSYDPGSEVLFQMEKRGKRAKSPAAFTIWKLEVGATEAKPLVRWPSEARMDFGFGGGLFAKIVNENLVITKNRKNAYQAWDIKEKSLIYELKSESFRDAPAD